MCFGPVRVSWDPANQEVSNHFDDKLVMLVGFDLIEIRRDHPEIASPNEYDLYFMAREHIETHGAKLCVWFPFPTSPMPMLSGKNDYRRKKTIFERQTLYLRNSLGVQSKKDPRSFGWDKDLLRDVLPLSPDQTVSNGLQHYLDQIAQDGFQFARNLQVSKPVGHVEKKGTEQYFIVELNGVIERGEVFHICFKAREAYTEGVPGEPCSGEAALYYYDADFDEDILSKLLVTNGSAAPVVPCAMLQVSMMFPSPVRILKNDNFFSKKKTRSRSFRVQSRFSSTGKEFVDWRWFVLYNAHLGHEEESFILQWALPDCREEEAAIKGLIGTLFTSEETELACAMLPVFDDLAYQEREAVKHVAKGEKLQRPALDAYFRARNKLLTHNPLLVTNGIDVAALEDRVLIAKAYKVWERAGGRDDWDALFAHLQ